MSRSWWYFVSFVWKLFNGFFVARSRDECYLSLSNHQKMCKSFPRGRLESQLLRYALGISNERASYVTKWKITPLWICIPSSFMTATKMNLFQAQTIEKRFISAIALFITLLLTPCKQKLINYGFYNQRLNSLRNVDQF